MPTSTGLLFCHLQYLSICTLIRLGILSVSPKLIKSSSSKNFVYSFHSITSLKRSCSCKPSTDHILPAVVYALLTLSNINVYYLALGKGKPSLTFDGLPGQWVWIKILIVRHGPFHDKELVDNINQLMQQNFKRVNIKPKLDCMCYVVRSR